jgi:hypothetical protein
VANLTPNWLASVMGTGIAATGALLIPYAPAGQVRLCLLLCCYAMFGITLIGPSHHPRAPTVQPDLVVVHLPGRHLRS